MKAVFDRYTIYDFSDEAIIIELCEKIRKLRRSCCISQTELAQKSGVSIASIKRIEAGTVTDLNICTIVKILRACGKLEGMAEFIPDVPESQFLIDQKTGKGRKALELSTSQRAWDEAENTMEDAVLDLQELIFTLCEDAANLYDFNLRLNDNVKTL